MRRKDKTPQTNSRITPKEKVDGSIIVVRPGSGARAMLIRLRAEDKLKLPLTIKDFLIKKGD
jgi:hypothetical protein